MDDNNYTLLICSVGGTPEPLVVSLCHWRPERVLFIPSEQTRPIVEQVLLEYAEKTGQQLTPGRYRVIIVNDAEDLSGCLQTIRALDQEVEEWSQKGGGFHVVADFTAGTKCLSAAFALQARRWPCRFSYVGGERRTKEGVGVVETGSERVVYCANPWDALGYQAMEECVAVFNHGGYTVAAGLLQNAICNLSDTAVKRTLATLKSLVEAYAAWDRFDHVNAVRYFSDTLKNRNDLAAIFVDSKKLITRLEKHQNQVNRLHHANEPSTEWVADLLHNADRRAAECRYDDAVARLYRATEALAQIHLREAHGIRDTGSVSIERLPETLRNEWKERIRDGALSLGLQDAYRLLKERGDELGEKFIMSGLGDTRRSPLVARNRSILAHGFDPIGEAVYRELRQKLCLLVPFEIVKDSWSLPRVR